MFAFHETTQRRICRLIFLVGCVLPTLLTLAGIAYCNRPWRQADWQRTLAQSLHVRAALDKIASPRPGTTVLTNLRLADLRTDLTLGSIGTLSFQRQNSRLTLQADHLEINAEQLPAFAISVATWLATSELEPLDFHADRLTITNRSLQVVQLENLSIRSNTSEPKHQRFRLTALDEAGGTLKIALENKAGTLRLVIDSKQVALPAWLIGKLVPGVGGCGEAKFAGEITAESSNQRVCGKMNGHFDQVELQAWIGDDSPHRLQGNAQVQLEQLAWSDGVIEVVRGKIEAHHGAASYSLLLAMHELFSCVTGADWDTLKPATPEALTPFDQLAISFGMTTAGVTLAGECAGGELVIGDRKPLLYGPQVKFTFPVAQFVQLFHVHRPHEGWITATREAHEMARELPLPGGKDGKANSMRK